MRLYNTLSGETEEFTPLSSREVSLYTCGPTVYDYPHIGNWFTFIRYDVLNRVLVAAGYKTNWVLNITDVGHLVSDADEGEDKLEKGAKREGKTAQEIANFYTEYFLKGMDRLNFSKPSVLPRATEHIPEQIELIERLQSKGFTYKIDDGIYFDTSKFPQYKDFARLDIDNQLSGARIAQNAQKKNPQDFALWKLSPANQKRDMEWDSPWGKGFPGWHIECSAMILKYLGETIDIHSGGIDHIPVHHTNEIAQSQAATGKPLAQFWMHTNHILIDDQKISKSLGNGITLEDIEKKGYDLKVLRLLVLQSHYRSQSKFSWDEMAAANNRLASLQAMADLRWQIIDFDYDLYNSSKSRGEYQEFPLKSDDFERYQTEIKKELLADLSTPKALSILSEIEEQANMRFVASDGKTKFLEFLEFINQVLGIDLTTSRDITKLQKAMIQNREDARALKDWKKADKIRKDLETQGIKLRDTVAHGSLWSRI